MAFSKRPDQQRFASPGPAVLSEKHIKFSTYDDGITFFFLAPCCNNNTMTTRIIVARWVAKHLSLNLNLNLGGSCQNLFWPLVGCQAHASEGDSKGERKIANSYIFLL